MNPFAQSFTHNKFIGWRGSLKKYTMDHKTIEAVFSSTLRDSFYPELNDLLFLNGIEKIEHEKE